MRTKNSLTLSSLVKLLCTCFLVLAIGFNSNATSAKADAIYHAFDECLANVEAKLPEIEEAGYAYIQISPPNTTPPRSDDACTSDNEWWMQYQPFDYVVDGNLGNEKDFKSLIDAAHDRGIKVIVDVVLNHMANYQRYENEGIPFPEAYPTFNKKEYFHETICNVNYSDPYQVENGRLGCGGSDTGLPDLKTESSFVREQAKNYLQKLQDLGADGFRFDAVKHMPLDDWQAVFEVVPNDELYYGEVVGENIAQSEYYIPIFPKVTDFQLVNTLKAAFDLGGDLRSLVDPANSDRALRGSEAVTFARNHDIWAPGQFDTLKFDEGDLPLATAYVLAVNQGTPLILKFDAFNPTVLAASKFHKKMKGEPQFYRGGNEIANGANNPNLLFIERGDKGLAIINKGKEFDVPAAQIPGLAEGCYQELQYDFEMCVGANKYVNKWGTADRGGIDIGPRTALFFVKTEA